MDAIIPITETQDYGYILCQAQGGLNDILCQIWHCVQYALQHNRNIILTHWSYFQSDLFDVFDFSDFPVKIFPIDHMKNITYSAVEPADCEEYVRFFLDKRNNTAKIGSILTIDTRKFDRTKIYPSTTLLLHDSCGGGLESVECFTYIRFTKKFQQMYTDITKTFPSKYNAVHIRNTDIQTNTENILNIIQTYNTIPLFVGTDNLKLKQEILQIIPNTFSTELKVTQENNANLHYIYEKNILEFSVIDLLVMVFSINTIEEIYEKAHEEIKSGFTRLIDKLKLQKISILSKLNVSG